MIDDAQAMEEAVALAARALGDDVGGPFGAVVVRSGEVVGRGRNRVLADRDPTAHAEVLAIRDACRNLGTHVLEGQTLVSSCEPCPMCLSAALWARLGRVVYAVDRLGAARAGFDDALFYEQLTRPASERRVAMHRLHWPEAERLMEAWSRRPGRTAY